MKFTKPKRITCDRFVKEVEEIFYMVVRIFYFMTQSKQKTQNCFVNNINNMFNNTTLEISLTIIFYYSIFQHFKLDFEYSERI